MSAPHSKRGFLYWLNCIRSGHRGANSRQGNRTRIKQRNGSATVLPKNLRYTALIPVLLSLALVIFWRHDQQTTLAENPKDASPTGQVDLVSMDMVYIPAVVAPSPEAAVAATATSRPVPTIVVTPSPTFRPTEIATVGPTPTSTTVASDTLRFEGTSNQGQLVLVETLANLSAVTKFEMDAQIICPNAAGPVELRVSDINGFGIQGDRFQIRTPSRGGNDHMILGTVESDGSRMNGTWSIWLDGPESLQPCNNKGTWSADQQVSQ